MPSKNNNTSFWDKSSKKAQFCALPSSPHYLNAGLPLSERAAEQTSAGTSPPAPGSPIAVQVAPRGHKNDHTLGTLKKQNLPNFA